HRNFPRRGSSARHRRRPEKSLLVFPGKCSPLATRHSPLPPPPSPLRRRPHQHRLLPPATVPQPIVAARHPFRALRRPLPPSPPAPLATRHFLSPSPASTSSPLASFPCSLRPASSPSSTLVFGSPPGVKKSSPSAPTNTTGATSAAPPSSPKPPATSIKAPFVL